MENCLQLKAPGLSYDQFKREDSADFAKKVRKKIDGWYQKEEYYTKAVERIALQREEIIGLIEKVEKVDVKKLLKYLDTSGFYYRPSAASRHHNFPGGLAEHSLGVFRIVEEWNNMIPDERRNSELYKFNLSNKPVACDIFTEKMSYDDMVLAGICHDLCKAKHCYFDGRIIRKHYSDHLGRHHASISVKRLEANGIKGKNCDELLLAVLKHMRLYSIPKSQIEAENQRRGRASMLAIAVWAADKLDASRHPAGKLHRDR